MKGLMKSIKKNEVGVCFVQYRIFLLSIVLIFLTIDSYGQDRLPHIAVIPFSPINVSESDAEAITGLFETALVNTGAYRVIEQSQMHEILKVQEFSMSDCTSEECAVEIGQLLSAEQIILGTLASVGGKYILYAKIVDVAKGISLKADKVERPTLSDMTDGAEVLAYKLAGLTFRREAEEEMVEGFGEIFVQTDPPDAEVYVNGVNKGITVITNLLPSMEEQKEAIVTARLDRHYFSIGAGAALTIPVGNVGGIMMLAFYPEAFFNFNLSYYWGVISFGILVGINIDSTREEVTYQYNLLSIPFGVSAKYSTNFDFPLYGFIEIAGGLAINIVTFKEVYKNMSDVAAAKVFLLPTIGGGFFLTPELSASLYAGFLMIFFDNSAYIGIAPGLKIEFNF